MNSQLGVSPRTDQFDGEGIQCNIDDADNINNCRAAWGDKVCWQ